MVLQKRIAKEEIQMQISLLLMQQIAQLFLILLMGYAVVKTGLLKASDSKVLSVVFVYLVMPCVVLNAFQINRNQFKFGTDCRCHFPYPPP